MSEKNNRSGVRTDTSISDFMAKVEKMDLPKPEKPSKIKSFFGKVADTLSSLGFMPVLTSNKNSKVYKGETHCHHHTPSFRETYRADSPRRTHEDRVREHIAYDAYMDMVDGKGDDER